MKEAVGFSEVNEDTCYVPGTAWECPADGLQLGSVVEKDS